ncbi:3-mercaptopyruvate sulfurtransferase isoform X1 [Stegostoma tigrinum]|uniref:3-mercaptopyruvate sulfurtransferase isoform X1 n=1 Tax=Stegostoma tigrinum TaxID=3053191 RepID=UPI00202B484F|nr:3-mercaptopyruvate sulfurtransferase isoform X1 [Stegostoma tigrinum]
MALVRSLVSASWLDKAISSAKAGPLRVLDSSWYLPKLQRDGKKEFKEKHIPGAIFFDLDECSDHSSPYEHMMPGQEHFSRYVGNLGICNDTHVVIYDASDFGMYCAPRVWWMFRAFGHSRVSVLDGGLLNWCRDGFQVTSELRRYPVAEYKANAKPCVKTYREILDNIRSKQFQLVDARSEGRFKGTEPEPREGIEPGHIPNSINIPFNMFLDPETRRMKSEKELLHLFEDHNIDLKKPLVGTCGTGITACFVAFCAHLCGKEDVMIYDGSWLEWFAQADPSHIISET